MRFEVIARAIIIVEGRILCQRNVKNDEFALPGGHIERGETVRETLIRELKEETGMSMFVGKLTYINENFFEQEGEDVHEIGFYFLSSVIGDIPERIESREGHIDFHFIDLEELDQKDVYPKFLRSVLPKDAKKDFSDALKHIIQKGEEEHWTE